MSQIRLEKHRQLTLPAEIVARAGLQQDDLLDVYYENNTIVLRPVRKAEHLKPTRSIMDYAGLCKGVWGNTPEETAANLAEDRASWDR